MKFKRILSILMLVTNFGVVAFNKCSAMGEPYICVYDERIRKYVTPYTVRCKECGWIGQPKISQSYTKRLQLYCGGCGRINYINRKLFLSLSHIYSNNKKFGICPNSAPGHSHIGTISDKRIKVKYDGLTRKELIDASKSESYKFYCYECKQHFNIRPNSIVLKNK